MNADADGTSIVQEVDIENIEGMATVDSTDLSLGELAFDAVWVNTRDDEGLADGDFVGVTDFTGTVGSFTDGAQGYEIQDADGLYRLTFEEINLAAVGAVTLSLDAFLQETGWETDDLFSIKVVTDQGVETLIDTAGLDIDDLGIEGAWTDYSITLGADVNTAQLVVELDSNSGSESLFLDNIKLRELVSVGQSFEDEATGGQYVSAATDGHGPGGR